MTPYLKVSEATQDYFQSWKKDSGKENMSDNMALADLLGDSYRLRKIIRMATDSTVVPEKSKEAKE